MKRRVAMAMLITASVGAVAPVWAKARHAGVSCKAVREALAAGKSKEDVAAQMKTSTQTVDRCQANAGGMKHAAKKTSSAK